jgi:RNAse (barnase) inhibitor barstar
MKKTIAKFATGITMHKQIQKTFFKFILLLIAINITQISNAGIYNIINNATITGSVLDNKGEPIQNCKVIINDKEAGSSNTDGSFSIVIDGTIEKNYQIVFTKEGYNNVVRNYNFNMTNAQYTISLSKICICNPIENCFANNIQFNFEKNNTKITESQKKNIDALIECLKANPEKEIKINYNTLNPKRQIGNDRLEAVVNYFVLKGIASYRIKQEKVAIKSEKSKDIEILSY